MLLYEAFSATLHNGYIIQSKEENRKNEKKKKKNPGKMYREGIKIGKMKNRKK